MQHVLTDRAIRAAKSDPKRDIYLSDGNGLRLRIVKQTSLEKPGARIWTLRYKRNAKEYTYTLGTYPDTSLAEAREEAAKARKIIRSGQHPAEVARAAQALTTTVNQLFDDWMTRYVKKGRRPDYVGQILRVDLLRKLGTTPIAEISTRHIRELVDAIVDRGSPVMANRVLSYAKQMFSWGCARGFLQQNPAASLTSIHAGGKESPRERVLEPEEIAALFRLLPTSGLSERKRCWILILLGTGARSGELRIARKEHIDFEAGIWTIPAASSKNGKAYQVPISRFSAPYFQKLRDLSENGWLLPARDDSEPIGEKALPKAILDRQCEKPLKNRTMKSQGLVLPGGRWTAHDLRRTVATQMREQLEIDSEIVERCLNHVPANGSQRPYDHAKHWRRRVEALERWGQYLQRLANPAIEDTRPAGSTLPARFVGEDDIYTADTVFERTHRVEMRASPSYYSY